MKRSEIYLKAAINCKERLDEQRDSIYGCHAIARVSGRMASKETFPEFFLMEPDEKTVSAANQNEGGWFGRSWDKGFIKHKNIWYRIDALLLAHEIAKSNGN